MSASDTAYVTCPLCEATCGLELRLDGDSVVGIRGDDEDVLSHGFICPKGASLRPLHEDPDRIRTRWSAATVDSSRPAGTRRWPR